MSTAKMAVFPPPVELPTNRQSRLFEEPTLNAHDPNYIPILNGASIKVDFSKPTFESFPSVPTPARQHSDVSLTRTKSSLAPERVPQEYTIFPTRKTSARNYVASPPSTVSPKPSSDGTTSPSENNTASSVGSSTPGAMSLLEDQLYAIPGNVVPKPEDVAFPTVPVSHRSSISSTRKSIPTSRYNRKAVTGLPNIPPAPSSKTSSPRGSPRMSPVPETDNQLGTFRSLSATKTPTPPPPPPPPEPLSIQSTPKLMPMKSTASERRKRALNSNPYAGSSLKSNRSLPLDETDEQPLVSVNEKMPASPQTQSRSNSMVKSQQSPIPSTPLPDLPPKAKTPSVRSNKSAMLGSFNNGTTPVPKNEHAEMVEFMMTNKTIVFRRFDEVHVRLLLQLQDEISELERELTQLENTGNGRPDKNSKTTTIMQDLRRTLAEYDHLFANWSRMQASKINPQTRDELEKWLRTPAHASSGALSKSAKDDIAWLQNAKDLSTVSLVSHGHNTSADQKEKRHRSVVSGGIEKVGGAAKKGWGTWFGCGGKRK